MAQPSPFSYAPRVVCGTTFILFWLFLLSFEEWRLGETNSHTGRTSKNTSNREVKSHANGIEKRKALSGRSGDLEKEIRNKKKEFLLQLSLRSTSFVPSLVNHNFIMDEPPSRNHLPALRNGNIGFHLRMQVCKTNNATLVRASRVGKRNVQHVTARMGGARYVWHIVMRCYASPKLNSQFFRLLSSI